MTPLRAATIWCCGLRPGLPVALGALATLAEVEPSRAKAYTSILIARRALVDTAAGVLPGPAWSVWIAEPGGRPQRAADPHAATEQMDAMRRSMVRNIREMAERRGWGQRELARRSGVPQYAIARLFRRSKPLPATACVLVARAFGLTVEQLL